MDILPDRTQSHLTSYFREIDRAQRLRVEYFVCDMWQPYVDLAHTFFQTLKSALINIIFFIRQVTWAMENVRKRLQKTMTITMRKYYKRSHKLLLTRYHKLAEDFNNKIKVLKRISYGIRNFERFRSKILHSTN